MLFIYTILFVSFFVDLLLRIRRIWKQCSKTWTPNKLNERERERMNKQNIFVFWNEQRGAKATSKANKLIRVVRSTINPSHTKNNAINRYKRTHTHTHTCVRTYTMQIHHPNVYVFQYPNRRIHLGFFSFLLGMVTSYECVCVYFGVRCLNIFSNPHFH